MIKTSKHMEELSSSVCLRFAWKLQDCADLSLLIVECTCPGFLVLLIFADSCPIFRNHQHRRTPQLASLACHLLHLASASISKGTEVICQLVEVRDSNTMKCHFTLFTCCLKQLKQGETSFQVRSGPLVFRRVFNMHHMWEMNSTYLLNIKYLVKHL